jgi:hypothetical protein
MSVRVEPDQHADDLELFPVPPPPPPRNRARKKARSRAWWTLAFISGLGTTAYVADYLFPNAFSTRARASVGGQLSAFDGTVQSCDVLVVGGTPSGVGAALAASRRGAKVLLIEERPGLGGDMVYAMLNMFDVVGKPGEASPVHGIFAEFFDQLGMAFSIDKSQKLLESAVSIEPNLHTHVRTRVVKMLKQGDRVTGAILATGPTGKGQEFPVQAKIVIDATNDATIAAKAGAGYYIGRENANPDKRMQSAGLLFSLSGVDWKQVRDYVRSKKLIRADQRKNLKYAIDVAPAAKTSKGSKSPLVWLRMGGMTGNYAWERGDVIKDYKPRGRNILFLSLNFGRQDDGTVVLNTLNIVNVNGLSEYSVRRARQEAIRELPYFIAYLRKRMPGFEQVKLAKVAPELYIRETRHIHGYYALKADDVRSQKRFFDRVAMVSYPLDLHPYTKTDVNPFGPQRYYYTIPLRALVPRKVDNVFVASRSLSATYSAAGSARVIPVTMACGEAVGAAAWLCTRENITPHTMMKDSRWVRQLQANLRDWGADIGDKYPSKKPQPVSLKNYSPRYHNPILPLIGPPKYQERHKVL